MTILYDAFGESKEVTKDWGFSALVEHNGKRILFDTGNFVLVNQLKEVSPGIFLVRTVSQKKGTLELPELTLAIKRPNGLLLVDGCSHAGIEAILEAASAVDPRTEIVFGGLHLNTTPGEEIDVLVENLKTKWKVDCAGTLHR